MSIEITSLALSGTLVLALTLLQGTRNVIVLGLPTAAGNQHDIDAWTGWNDRLNRAVKNQIEAMAVFGPIAISVHLLGVANDASQTGALLFVGARAVHAVVFVVGIPYLRTAAWFVGVVGILMVGSALIS